MGSHRAGRPRTHTTSTKQALSTVKNVDAPSMRASPRRRRESRLRFRRWYGLSAGTAALLAAVGGAVHDANDYIPASQTVADRVVFLPSPSIEDTRARERSTISRGAPAARDLSPLRRSADRLVQRRLTALTRFQDQASEYVEELEAEARATRWVLPLSNYQLTGTFGESSYLWSTVHTGLDFAAPEGTPLVSIAAGTVTETGDAGSYGYRTIITLSDGTELWYCHQSSILVEPGEVVSPGQTIGAVGSTGNVTGPHLHLEVRPLGGDPVDPYTALLEQGIQP